MAGGRRRGEVARCPDERLRAVMMNQSPGKVVGRAVSLNERPGEVAGRSDQMDGDGVAGFDESGG